MPEPEKFFTRGQQCAVTIQQIVSKLPLIIQIHVIPPENTYKATSSNFDFDLFLIYERKNISAFFDFWTWTWTWRNNLFPK